MNSYGKLLLAASLSFTTGVVSAAEVVSYFNNTTALDRYNVSKQALKGAKITQHLAAQASGQLSLVSQSKQAEQQFLTFEQSYQGLKIWNHQLVLMLDAQGEIRQGYGSLVSDLARDLPQIPPPNKAQQQQQLKQFIKKGFSDQPRVFRNKSSQRVIYLDKTNTARLAYKFSFFTDVTNAPSQPQKILAFVDVISGQTLAQNDVLHRALTVGGSGPSGNAKVSRADYQEGGLANYPPTTFSVSKRTFYKTCSFDSHNVETRDYKHSVNSVSSAFKYDCADSTANNHQPYNTALSALNDAHYHGQITSLMYQDYLGQKPFLNHKIIQNVHYGLKMDQAFYDDGQISYGDGDWIFYPMVALDVVAHEIAHGFTEEYGSSSTKTMLTGQAAAINESFSDLSGAAAEYYLYHANEGWTDDWQSNAESYQYEGALRYFDKPTLDDLSIDHIKDYQPSTPAHYAAGIFNKAFHRLVTVSGISAAADGEVNPWNTKYGFILFATANKNCWVSNSTFIQAADCVFNQAATITARLGNDGVVKTDGSRWSTNELKNHIRKAFAQVGINLAVNFGLESDFSHSSKFLDYQFASKSRSNGNTIPLDANEDWRWLWHFGDGQTSTAAQPQHHYATPGEYVVSLETASTDGQQSDRFSLAVTATADYCASGGSNFDKYFIESVAINGVTKQSNGSAYSDFTATAIPVLDGREFNVEIAAGQPANSVDKNKHFYLWIDANNDGLFDKTNELVFNGTAKDKVSTTISVTGQSDELLRVRAMVSFGIISEACGDFSFGETEDYALNVASNNAPPILIVQATQGINQVTFANTTNDSRIASWSWDFGDGSNSNKPSPVHQYARSGNYKVNVSALDNKGTTLASWQQAVAVTTSTIPAFTQSTSGLTAVLDAATSEMPVNSVLSWDFGDSSPAQSSARVEHNYAISGVYPVTLTITNADNPGGLTVAADVTVSGEIYLPSFNHSVVNDVQATFTNTSQVPSDLHHSLKDATLLWDFGDGIQSEVITSDFSKDQTHTYTSAGLYIATLTVKYTNSAGRLITSNPANQLVNISDLPGPVTYCTATGVTEYEHIAKVNFNNQGDMSNGEEPGVVNPGNPIILTVGENNTYRIDTGTPDGVFYSENYHVWIDMNGNGSFGDGDWRNDKTERVIAGFDSTEQGFISGSFTLPAEKFQSGSFNTRMRILQFYAPSSTNSVDPCSDYSAFGEGGEIEDYSVTVVNN